MSFQSLFSIVSSDPRIALFQWFIIGFSCIHLFLLFFSARDVSLRISRTWVQILLLIFIAFIPVLGYILYLLFRPSQTIAEKNIESDIQLLKSKLFSKKTSPKSR